ncbi:MAG: hypothetical protein K6C12_11210 [Oscillospiraceae bacterium]|nr:hypothetical protein [Oscillospiraceae bacterium]
MNNRENDTKRPLDAEKLPEEYEEKIVGGTGINGFNFNAGYGINACRINMPFGINTPGPFGIG